MKQKYEVCPQFWKNSLKDHFGIGYTVCNKGLEFGKTAFESGMCL